MTSLEMVLDYIPATIRDKIYKIEPVLIAEKMQNRTGTECIKNAKWNRY